jgi:hypothetical protein
MKASSFYARLVFTRSGLLVIDCLNKWLAIEYFAITMQLKWNEPIVVEY